MRIVLASGSPRRREILRELFQDFEIIPSSIDENIPFTTPHEYVVDLARLKAGEVFHRVQREWGSADLLTIGADTTVVLDNKPIGKPSTEKEAEEILFSLRNTTHHVYTGVCVLACVRGELCENSGYKKSVVKIDNIPDEEIHRYIQSGAAFDKAGGYGIQDFSQWININSGDYDNVVGLPLELVRRLVRI